MSVLVLRIYGAGLCILGLVDAEGECASSGDRLRKHNLHGANTLSLASTDWT